MDSYIGPDVHATSCTAAIIDPPGKRLGHHVIETNGQALGEGRGSPPGPLGTQEAWPCWRSRAPMSRSRDLGSSSSR